MNKAASAIAHRYRYAGFALPTVIIIFVVMLTSLVLAVSTVGVSRSAISDQYYNRLAREATLSGVLSGKIDTSIAVGQQFACSISSNEVYCWGRNDNGQLGNGSYEHSSIPVKVDHSTGLAGKTLTHIVSTTHTTCVVASGDVYCWGRSSHGQLGIGVASTTQNRPALVGTIGAHNGRPVTDISTSARAYHICAVASGRAYC